jgi:flagellar protein FlgJ
MDISNNALPPAAANADVTGSYLDFGGLGKLKGMAHGDAKAATRETAQQFEAMFLQMMMKSMRDATPKSDLVESAGKDTFESMFDKEVSVAMAKRGSLGLADMLVKNMPDTTAQQPSTAAMLEARNLKPKAMSLLPGVAKPISLNPPPAPLSPLPRMGGPIALNPGDLPLQTANTQPEGDAP